jgi:radical SAM protein
MTNFEEKPLLIFWETTRACNLFCSHCRASAINKPLPGELTQEDGSALIEEIKEFGKPYPTVILTGGDPLMRRDLFCIVKEMTDSSIPVAVSPAVTELLDANMLINLKRLGVASISVSLDSISSSVHDKIRSIPGTFDRTVQVMKRALEIGLPIQVNTTIMKQNMMELPLLFEFLRRNGIRVWELFFLINVGRGENVQHTDSNENESICNFLYDASKYGMVLRCVEAPFIRRIAELRSKDDNYWSEPLYYRFRDILIANSGKGDKDSSFTRKGTLDGDGTIFIAYDGDIQPGGLLPYRIGNVRKDSLADKYRNDGTLKKIRRREFKGACGVCFFRHICGGSRARSYAYYKDPLSSDSGCIFALDT